MGHTSWGQVEDEVKPTEKIAKVMRLALATHVVLIDTLGTCLPMSRARKEVEVVMFKDE
jgi:hypothetical protein